MACSAAELQKVAQELWELDDNRVPFTHLKLNVQGGKKSYEAHDAAKEPLFAAVTDAIWSRPTYSLFYKLLDNYHKETGAVESETHEEKQEIVQFLDALMATRPMQHMHRFLASKDLVAGDVQQFKHQLYQMWFSYYRRDGSNDSCGFEHVMVGESDGPDVSGLHNWVQFLIQERKGKLDYRGFIKPRNHGDVVDGEDRVLSVQFVWEGELKPITTILVGTSPEFEMALYTLFFIAGEERNNIDLAGYDLCIRAYRINSNYGDKVGTVFPELLGEN